MGGLVGSSEDLSSGEVGDAVSGFDEDAGLEGVVAEGVYEMIGGGSSNPSVAFLDNCLAKSLACHHSKNLSAKILVGSNSFNPAPNLPMANLGSNKLLIPRLPPGVVDEGAFARASNAWKSA